MILPPPLPLLLSPDCLNPRSECETNPERVVAWLPKSDLSFRLALSVPVPWVEQAEMEVSRKQGWEASQGAWRPAGSSCLLQAAPVVESLQCAWRWVSALEGREHWLLYPEEVESRGLEWFGKGWATSTSRVGMQIQVQWAPKTCPWTPRVCHLSRNISWVSSSSETGDFSQMSCLKTHSSLPLAPHLFSFQFLCTSFPEWILWSLFCHYCLLPQESAVVPHCYQNTNPLALCSKPCPASVFLMDFILLCSLGALLLSWLALWTHMPAACSGSGHGLEQSHLLLHRRVSFNSQVQAFCEAQNPVSRHGEGPAHLHLCSTGVARQAPPLSGIPQARVLEWAAIPFSRGSSWPRDWTRVSGIAGRFFIIWATREALIFTLFVIFSLHFSWKPLKAWPHIVSDNGSCSVMSDSLWSHGL